MLKALTICGLLAECAALLCGILNWSDLTISQRLFWVVLVPLFAACLVAWTSFALVQKTGNRAWMSVLYLSTAPSIMISALFFFLSGTLGH